MWFILFNYVTPLALSAALIISLRWLHRRACGDADETTRLNYQVQALTALTRPHTAPHTLSLHYAPHTRADSTTPASVAGMAQSVPCPAFADLLGTAQVGRGQPLLLGYADNGPVWGDFGDLYSTGIGGLQGSGKTSTAVNLVLQSLLHGARIAMIDPHGGDAQSLSTRLQPVASAFMAAPASDARSVADLLALVGDELDRRVRNNDPRAQPLLVIADEFTALMRGEHARAVAALFERIAQEGRKYRVFGMLLGQSWLVSRAGGSELRNCLASAYVHRMRPDEARRLTGLTADTLPADVLELPAGTAYMWTTRGELRRVALPYVTDADVLEVSRRLEPARELSVEPAPDARMERVRTLVRAGATQNDVIRQVFGVDGRGRQWQQAADDLRTMLARMV